MALIDSQCWSGRLPDGYSLLRRLRRDGPVQSLLAQHVGRGETVVVKAVDALDLAPAVAARIRREVATLARVRHSCLPAVVDHGEQGGVLFTVRSHIPGPSLAERLEERSLDPSEVIDLGRGLLGALATAHHEGILHRNIHPRNILAGGSGVKLLDFGVLQPELLAPVSQFEDLGRVRYLSPEQAGTLSREVNERSDLYSLGVVLIEALVGHPPFLSSNVHDLLREHLSARPVPPCSSGGIPPLLDEVLQRMLRKDPRDRYQSARAVLADLEEIARAMEGTDVTTAIVVGGHDRRETLTEPALIGRENELGGLEAHVERTRAGRGGLVVLDGDSGVGKSRLLEALADRCSLRPDVRLFRGQALPAGGGRPFQLLVGLADDLITELNNDPSWGEALSAQLVGHHATLRTIFPDLKGALADDGVSDPQESTRDLETHVFEALGALFDALGDPSRPAVVLLDDCQWADEMTTRFLNVWRRRRLRHRHVLVVVAQRAGEGGLETDTDAGAGTWLLRLDPLGPSDVRRLVTSMAGELPAEALDVVADLSGGNPFLAVAVLRGLVESGALVAEPSGWRTDREAMTPVQSSHEAAAVVARRIEMLPRPTLAVLSAAAVLGREFDVDFAGRLAGQNAEETLAAIDEARRRNLVWLTGRRSGGSFIHDRVREAVLQRLGEGERRALHREAAGLLEQSGTASVFELAYHFGQAGDLDAAQPYALASAEEARSHHALAMAEQLYRVAADGHPQGEVEYRVAEGLGDVLMLRGKYDEARDHLDHARSMAQGGFQEAYADAKLGELAFKLGDSRAASRYLERGLALAEQRVPKRHVTLVVSLMWEVAVQVLHRLAPRFLLVRRQREKERNTLLLAQLYGRLAYAWWFERGATATLWAQLRQLNLAERGAPSPELGFAYALQAATLAGILGRSRLADRFVGRSLAVRRSLGDRWGEGHALHIRGAVLHTAARYRDGIAHCDEAITVFRQTGDRWEMNTARLHKAMCLLRLGEHATAAEEAWQVYLAGKELHDRQATGMAVELWSKARRGQVDAEVIKAERDQPHVDLLIYVSVLQAEAVRLLASGDPETAVTTLEEARSLLRRVGLMNVYAASVFPWLATSRRLALASDPVGGRARRARLRQLRRAARRSLRWARLHHNQMPHALREAGLAAAASGRRRRARRRLEQALDVAARHGAQEEYRQSLEAWVRICHPVGWPQPESSEASAGPATEIDTTAMTGPTIGLVDRYGNLLELGRRITTSSRDEVRDAIHDAMVALLRAERCLILPVEEDSVRIPAGERDAELAEKLAAVALASGEPAVYAEGTAPFDELAEAAAVAGVRSALTVPICVRGRPVSCVYVTNHQVAGLFTPDEERLARFVAALAGAAHERDLLEEEIIRRVLDVEEQERARIARDLHDEIGQALTSVLLTARLVSAALERPSPALSEASDRTAELRDLVAQALRSVRELAFDMRPTLLDHHGLVPALRRLASNISSRHGLSVTLTAELSESWQAPRPVETAYYRIAQEALTNVIRHAEASECQIDLRHVGGALELLISDDGVGFDAARQSQESLGLRGIQERVRLIGGSVTIKSEVGVGTSIKAEVHTSDGN